MHGLAIIGAVGGITSLVLAGMVQARRSMGLAGSRYEYRYYYQASSESVPHEAAVKAQDEFSEEGSTPDEAKGKIRSN